MRVSVWSVAVLAVAACWLTNGASAADDPVNGDDVRVLPGDLDAISLTAEMPSENNVPTETEPPEPKSTPEHRRRIKAPDGGDRAGVQALAESNASTAKAVTKVAAATMNTGPAPVVVLATGAVVIAIVGLAFQKRRASRKERDESDPMQQSLLFHDMDYAAM